MISKGNHVNFAPRFVLLAISEENMTSKFLRSAFVQCVSFGFCDIQNNQGRGKVYQPKPKASAYKPYLDLDYSGYLKNLIQ